MDELITVDGPVPATDITGPVLPHEHLALDLRRETDHRAYLDTGHEDAVGAELTELHEVFGLALAVDQTCRGMGRDTAALRRIARRSGVKAIASTGWYYEPFHTPEIAASSIEDLAATLVLEARDGLDGTDVRPGLIGEVGSHGDVPAEAEAKVLRAAARGAAQTGLPLATHAQLGHGGLAQLDLLTGEGLPAHRICVGHQDLLDDTAVHRRIAEAGAYLAFDTVGKESYQSDDVRLRLLLALLDAGHADRILLSCDISRHGYLRGEGGQGYGHLFRTFLPKARAAGVDDDLIDVLTRRNPLRFLTGTAPEEI